MEKSNLTRIIIEYLNKKGLGEITQLLEKESKITNESEIFRKIKNLIINKNYEEAITEIESNFNQKEIKLTIPFIRINQIFNCILEGFAEENKKDFLSQQKTLGLIRHIISKSSESEKYRMNKTLSSLACLLFIDKRDVLLEKMEQICPIANTKDSLLEYLSNILCNYNKNLLGKIQSKNLFSIISKVYSKQISECLFHNLDDSQARYSFFRDHSCPVTKVPYKPILTIDEHNEEVLNIVLSDDNLYFAVVLKSNTVMIYRICYEVRSRKKNYLGCKKRNNNVNNIKKIKNNKKNNFAKAENESNLMDFMDITDKNHTYVTNNINSKINNKTKRIKTDNAINSNRSSISSNNIELKSDKYLSGAYSSEKAKRKINSEGIYKENLDSDEEFSGINKNYNFDIEAFKDREQNQNTLASLNNNLNFDEVKRYSRRQQNKSKKDEEDFDKFFSSSKQEALSHKSSFGNESPCSDIFKSIINQESIIESGDRKNSKEASKIFSEGNLEKNSTAYYNFSNNRKNSSNNYGKNLNTIFEKFEDFNENGKTSNTLRHSLTDDLNNRKQSINNQFADNRIKADDKVFNTLKIFQLSKISAHKDIITSLSFSADATKILTASKDKTIKIHEVKTGKNILNISDLGHMVTSAQFHANETQILCTSLDSKIHIYSILGIKLDSIPSLNINEMVISEKLNLIILSAPILRAILIYDIETKTEQNKILINDTIINISLSKLDKGEHLLINSSNLTPVISLWNLTTNKCIRKYFGHRQERLTTKCCFGGFKEKFILCGSDNKEVFIWNRNKSLPVKIIKFHSAPVNAAVWPTNEKSDFLISVSDDHTVKFFGNENVGNCEFIQGKFLFDDNLVGSSESKANGNNMIIDEEKEGILLILKVMILIIIFYALLLCPVFFLAKEYNNKL